MDHLAAEPFAEHQAGSANCKPEGRGPERVAAGVTLDDGFQLQVVEQLFGVGQVVSRSPPVSRASCSCNGRLRMPLRRSAETPVTVKGISWKPPPIGSRTRT
jgi:hypothetical protein